MKKQTRPYRFIVREHVPEAVKTQLILTRTIVSCLKAEAKRRGTNVSALARRLIEAGLEELG
jgi:hypothetical protein